MSEDDCTGLVEEIHTMGVLEIVITGGEPLLCGWVCELARHIRQWA